MLNAHIPAKAWRMQVELSPHTTDNLHPTARAQNHMCLRISDLTEPPLLLQV